MDCLAKYEKLVFCGFYLKIFLFSSSAFFVLGDEAVDRILACRLKSEARCGLNIYNAIEHNRYEFKCCNNRDLCNMDFAIVQGK